MRAILMLLAVCVCAEARGDSGPPVPQAASAQPDQGFLGLRIGGEDPARPGEHRFSLGLEAAFALADNLAFHTTLEQESGAPEFWESSAGLLFDPVPETSKFRPFLELGLGSQRRRIRGYGSALVLAAVGFEYRLPQAPLLGVRTELRDQYNFRGWSAFDRKKGYNSLQASVGLALHWSPRSSPPPGCVPASCADQHASCGVLSDRCGGVVDCGHCVPPLVCGGGAEAYACAEPCTPTTCDALGLRCGAASNGCGVQLNCGECPALQTCGGGGVPGTCGCTARTCAEEGVSCGTIADGCGGVLACGPACTLTQCLHQDQEILFASAEAPFGREGLIVHKQTDADHPGGDAGDTAQREGWYWFGVWIYQNVLHQAWVDNPPRALAFEDVLRKLEPNGGGVFVRAPGYDPFGRDNGPFAPPKFGFTRDQMIPMVAAMGAWGQRDALLRLWNALPEDILGKHELQGHWHNALTGEDVYTDDPCNDIKNRDCSPRVDTTDCSRAGVCEHKCPFGVCWDACPCSQRNCDRDCTTNNCETVCTCFPCEGCILGNCWDCHTRVCVTGVDIQCGLEVADCLHRRVAEDAVCFVGESECEIAKQNQNSLYIAEAGACLAKKALDLPLCIAQKGAGIWTFTGDPLLPMHYNLFVRMFAKNAIVPLAFFPVTLAALSPVGFTIGEDNLQAEIGVRIACSDPQANLQCDSKNPDARDNVGDDLDDTVMLLVSRLFGPTPGTTTADTLYATRPQSYGSYLKNYCDVYGPLLATDSADTVRARILDGLGHGWHPDVSASFGAVRWYHLWLFGANPRLAKMYEPIMRSLVVPW